MYSAKEEAFLKDIQEASRRIQAYTEDTDYDAFCADIKTQDAVMRNLEIIGEAAKQLSEVVRQQAPQIPWRNIARMRDKLIHHYFGVNLDIVWRVVQDDLTPLMIAIDNILTSTDASHDAPKEQS